MTGGDNGRVMVTARMQAESCDRCQPRKYAKPFG